MLMMVLDYMRMIARRTNGHSSHYDDDDDDDNSVSSNSFLSNWKVFVTGLEINVVN